MTTDKGRCRCAFPHEPHGGPCCGMAGGRCVECRRTARLHEAAADVRALHFPRHEPGVPGRTTDLAYCPGCSKVWPCPTMQALDAAEDVS